MRSLLRRGLLLLFLVEGKEDHGTKGLLSLCQSFCLKTCICFSMSGFPESVLEEALGFTVLVRFYLSANRLLRSSQERFVFIMSIQYL
jgi:hypothetical protein